MAQNTERQILLEDVPGEDILFINLEGKAKEMNPKGERNFCVKIPEDKAAELMADGWKIKTLKPREGDETGFRQPILKVKANYDSWKPPQITIITSGGRTNLTEDLVSMVDSADILKADILINPFVFENLQGETFTYAYLKTMFITLDEDPLQRKYAHLSDTGTPEPIITDDGE